MKKAFTLVEVLITLAIIGVVSALTLPTLLSKVREKQTVARVKEAYSIFSQAYKQVVEEYDGLDSLVDSSLTNKENATRMFQEVTKHLKKAKSCDENTDCMGQIYTNLLDKPLSRSWDEYSNIQTGILLNGVSFWILSSISNGVYAGQLGIDINGKDKPNKLGVDFFLFRIDANGNVYPGGSLASCKLLEEYSESYPCEKPYARCSFNSEDDYNGYDCTNWLIQHGNMDYLRKNIEDETF